MAAYVTQNQGRYLSPFSQDAAAFEVQHDKQITSIMEDIIAKGPPNLSNNTRESLEEIKGELSSRISGLSDYPELMEDIAKNIFQHPAYKHRANALKFT